SLDPAVRDVEERWTPLPSRWFEIASERWGLPRVEWFARFDLLFGPNFVAPPTRKDVVVTVHDLGFRRFPDTAPHSTRRWLARLDGTLRRATRVIAVSESTRRDLVELYHVESARITVVPLGVDGGTFGPADAGVVEAARSRLGVAGPYVVYVGGIEPRKNLPNLLWAFARLGPDLSLVIVGSGVEWNPQGTGLLREALERLPSE